jgi:hypothetical protein
VAYAGVAAITKKLKILEKFAILTGSPDTKNEKFLNFNK